MLADNHGGGKFEAPGVLVGRFAHYLDPKRRLTIPAGWREQMGIAAGGGRGRSGYVFVMPGIHHKCLSLFTPFEMEQRLGRLRQRAISDAQASAFARHLGEVSEYLPLDVQGRIRIRDKLLNFAGLKSEVIMIGAFNKIELWSPELNPENETIDPAALAEVSKDMDF